MASSINASTSGAGGLITTADNTGILQLQTAGTTAVTVDASQNATFAGNILGKGSGIVLPYQYYRLNSTVAGANATGAQSIFGVGVTLASSTIYEFEGHFILIKTVGTTAHNVSTLFGGTATINNILYTLFANADGIGFPMVANSAGSASNNAITALQITGSITNATESISVILKGTVSVNASGTFIPQYQLSAAPGGAYTTQIGSYFKIAPLAASGANVNIGTWA